MRRGTARAERRGRHWDGAAATVDVFDAKADALALLAALGVPTGGLQIVPGGPPWLHPGRSGTLQFGPKNVDRLVRRDPPARAEGPRRQGAARGLRDRARCHPAAASASRPRPSRRSTSPTSSRVARDFAFVVGRDVPAGDIVKAAQGAERKLIAGVDVFDVYEGAGIARGQEIGRDRGDACSRARRP